MTSVKVKDLNIGDKLKHNGKINVIVESIEEKKVIVSKKPGSGYVFSISIFSANYEDLYNRVWRI